MPMINPGRPNILQRKFKPMDKMKKPDTASKFAKAAEAAEGDETGMGATKKGVNAFAKLIQSRRKPR